MKLGPLIPILFAIISGLQPVAAISHGVGPYNGLRALKEQQSESLKTQSDDYDPRKLYKAYNLSVPVDHFKNDDKYAPHTDAEFPLRYWFDASHYQHGGPVIVLASGETSGENRLAYLQKGILHQLIKETHGIGVILEHRFYGESMPKDDLSIDSLRFLDTQQALADYAWFAQHIQFPGLEWELLNSDWTSWIVYGGSYAGSFAAFLRTQYPNVFWGAVSSSGVPAAIIDYWQYWEAVRLYAPAECVRTTQDFMQLVDGILLGSKNKWKKKLKHAFGLSHVTDDADFASAISMTGVGSWQGKVWDSEVGDPTFGYYCGNITSDKLIKSRSRGLEAKVRKLIKKEGSLKATDSLVTRLVNWIGFLDTEVVQQCKHGKKNQQDCLGTNNASFWRQDSLAQSEWRSWTWQYCTQWGYFQTGSGIPSSIRPIVSRTLDMDYFTRPCRLAFNLPSPVIPDVDSINRYGAFNISYPRLAFVDGQADPWRWAGVHSPDAAKRKDWILEPYVSIKGGVHHWDEYGLFKNETEKGSVPAQVAKAQEYERLFVKSWVDEYNWRCRWQSRCDGTEHGGQKALPGFKAGQTVFGK